MEELTDPTHFFATIYRERVAGRITSGSLSTKSISFSTALVTRDPKDRWCPVLLPKRWKPAFWDSVSGSYYFSLGHFWLSYRTTFCWLVIFFSLFFWGALRASCIAPHKSSLGSFLFRFRFRFCFLFCVDTLAVLLGGRCEVDGLIKARTAESAIWPINKLALSPAFSESVLNNDRTVDLLVGYLR